MQPGSSSGGSRCFGILITQAPLRKPPHHILSPPRRTNVRHENKIGIPCTLINWLWAVSCKVPSKLGTDKSPPYHGSIQHTSSKVPGRSVEGRPTVHWISYWWNHTSKKTNVVFSIPPKKNKHFCKWSPTFQPNNKESIVSVLVYCNRIIPSPWPAPLAWNNFQVGMVIGFVVIVRIHVGASFNAPRSKVGQLGAQGPSFSTKIVDGIFFTQ